MGVLPLIESYLYQLISNPFQIDQFLGLTLSNRKSGMRRNYVDKRCDCFIEANIELSKN